MNGFERLSRSPVWAWRERPHRGGETDRAREIVRFFEHHGRLPYTGSKDVTERRLRHSYERYQGERRSGRLSANIADVLSAIPVWVTPIERSPATTALRIVEFFKLHERLPYKGSEDVTERRLRHSYSQYQRLKRQGKLESEVDAILTVIPEWTAEYFSGPDRLIACIEAFVIATGRMPQKRGGDAVEQRAGRAAVSFRCQFRKGTLSEARQKALERVPGWRWEADLSRPDLEIQRIAAYQHQYGCIPTLGKDSKDLRLGKRAAWYRQQHWEGKLSPERVAALAAIPGWWWGGPRTKR